MFTLGNKEAIVNEPGQYPVDIAEADLMKIQRFGTFKDTQIVSAFAQRYKPEALGQITVAVPSAADLGVGGTEFNVPVKFHLRIDSVRDDAEYSIDFIRKGRPLIIEFIVDGTYTAEQVATALEDALTEYGWKFLSGSLPFEFSRATAVLTFTMKPGNSYLDFRTRVEFLASRLGTDRTAFGKIVDATRVVTSAEPVNSGKHLEENVAMGLHANDGNYAIGGPNKTASITGKYVSITFTAKATEDSGVDGAWRPHAHLATVAADAEVGQRNVTFTLYFKEDTALMDADDDIITGGDTRGDVQKVVDFLVTDAGLGLTTFIKADGTAATTVADFMA